MKTAYPIIVAAVIVLVFSAAGNGDYEEAQRQQDEYCEMTQLWHQTKGKAGWPEYRDDVECNLITKRIGG